MGNYLIEDMKVFNDKYKEGDVIRPLPMEFQNTLLYDVSTEYTKKLERNKQIMEDRSINIIQSIKDNWEYETITGALFSKITKDKYKADPNFNPAKYSDFTPQDDHEKALIAQVVSEDEYAALVAALLRKREYILDMQSVGWGGALTLSAISEIGNVTNWLVPGSNLFKGMSGIKKLIAGGLYGSAINTAETAAVDAIYGDRTLTEYIATAALGFGFGSAFVGSGSKIIADADATVRQSDRIDTITNTFAKKHMSNQAKENKGSVSAAKLRVDPMVLDPEMKTRMQNNHLNPDDDIAVQAFIDVTEGNIPKQEQSRIDKVNIGSQGYSTQTSDNVLTRKWGYDLIEKPETSLDRIDKHTAALDIAMHEKKLSAVYGRGTVELWEKFSKTDPELSKDFGRHAFRKLHSADILDDVSEGGNKVLQQWADLRTAVWTDIVKRGHAAGVEEFADIDKAINHVSRNYDPPTMHELARTHGEDTMIALFKKGLLSDGGYDKLFQQYITKAVKQADEFNTRTDKSKGIDQVSIDKINDDIRINEAALDAIDNKLSRQALHLEGKLEKLQRKLYSTESKSGKHWVDVLGKDFDVNDIADSMAKSTWQRITRRALSPTRDANLLNTGNQELMRKTILGSTASTAEKDAMLHILNTHGRDIKGDITKDRMHIDMNATTVSPVTGKTITMADLFKNDAGAGEYMHMRYYIGRTSMAEQGPQYKSMEAITKNRDSIREYGSGIDMHADGIKADIDSYDVAVNQLLGLPLEDMTTKKMQISRNIRKLTGLNVLGKLGIPQAGEMGRAQAAVGIKNIFQAVPSLMKFVSDASLGKLDNELLNNIQDSLFGKIGDDYFMNHPKIRGDDLGLKTTPFENMMNRLGYVQGKLSGWHFIHTAERKFVLNGLSQKYYKEILNGTMSIAQKHNIGLTRRMESNIKNSMETYAKEVKTMWGNKKVKNLNIHKWDSESAMFFGRMLHRKSTNAIQEILIGETPSWMNKELGRFLTQFRSFNVVSMAKQGRRDVNIMRMGDAEPIQAFQFSLMTAGLASVGKIAWQASLANNTEQVLKDKMNIINIIRQALIYNGQVGWGVDILDISLGTIAPDYWNPIMGRRGYSGKGITGMIPGASYINKGIKGSQGVFNTLNPFGERSVSDLKAITGLLPLQNTVIGDLLQVPIKHKD